MAKAMVAFLAALVGHVPAAACIRSAGRHAAGFRNSGSKTADMAAVAPVLFPEMRKRGLADGEMVSLLASAGAMAETIPPCSAHRHRLGDRRFDRGTVHRRPAARRWCLPSALAILARQRTGAEDLRGIKLGAAAIVLARTFVIALPALVLPALIRFAVIRGIATATEVSTIGIAYAALAGLLIYRRFDWARVYPHAGRYGVAVGRHPVDHRRGHCMAWALTQSGFSHGLAGTMAAVPGGAWGFLASRSSCSSCWAACWRAFRRSFCSARCCFPSPARPGV